MHIFFVLAFLPSIIAVIRHNHATGRIFLLNLLLGWTGIGWIVALVWACTGERRFHAYPYPYGWRRF
jgi:threonine/homoserine/homoserine lactone efflux protein